MEVKYTQPDEETLKQERKQYDPNAGFLMAASQVISIHFHKAARVNNY